jgi:probable F420-dependent oxidoreductase
MTITPFRFGIRSMTSESGEAVRQLSRKAESLGYWAVLFTDHYAGPGAAMAAANHPPQPLAPIPMAVLAGECTTTLRVGFRVLSIDYHNPVVLAKQLATIDEFTNGRLEIGLGAGWIESEYEAMGIDFDPPGVRITRLGDVVDVIRQCMSGDDVNVSGESGVHANGFTGLPLPVQRPCPPIAIGGGGKRVLQLAARCADVIAFNFDNRAGKLTPDGPMSSTPERTVERLAWIREAAGERFESLDLEIGIAATAIGSDLDQITGPFQRLFGMPSEEIASHPHALVGEVPAIVDELLARRETYGFSTYVIRETEIDAFAPIVDSLSER